jgi:hypothetical protein
MELGAWSITTFLFGLVGGSPANVLAPQPNPILLALASVVLHVPLTEQLLD